MTPLTADDSSVQRRHAAATTAAAVVDPLEAPTEYRAYSEQSTTYRGFSTSITGSFQSLAEERVDACSLVCCGVLQSDRDRYLLTGIRPPSCFRRIVTHIVLPASLFMLAAYCSVTIPQYRLNQVMCTTLVALLILYLILQCCKGRWKRTKVRKELLWLKYHMAQGNTAERLLLHLEEDNDDISVDDSTYLQGQSKWDLACAHGLVGCYSTDITYGTAERPSYVPPNNLCGCLWNALTMACCGACCGCHLQLCGMCALAQEGREVERLLHLPRLDYLTYQPVLDYAPALWHSREHGGIPTLSQLSKDSLLNGTLGLVAITLIWPNRVEHVVVVAATMLHAVVVLALCHIPWHWHDVSVDALIKYFCSGFILSTTMAITWELAVGIVLRTIMTICFALSGIDVEFDDGGYQQIPWIGFASAKMDYHDYLQAFAKQYPVIYIIYMWINAYCLAALVEEVCKYFGFRVVDHVDVWSQEDVIKCVEVGIPEEHREDKEEEHEGSEEQHSASAATVPPIEAPRRTAKSIGAATTISMVAVALGFACCENLAYIFLYNRESSLLSKLSVLLIRAFMPVHPICAGLQSIGVCKRDLEGDSQHQLGRIVFPAIMVHGTFDFVLMLCDFLADGNAESPWALGGTLVAMLIVIGSLVYYFLESRAQRERLERMDHAANVDQSNLL